MKIIIQLLFAGLLSFPVLAQSPSEQRSLWHIAANINAGRVLDKDDGSVAQAKRLLETLSKKYHAPAEDLSGLVLYAYKQVRVLNDSQTSLFDLLEVSDYCGPDGKNITKNSLSKNIALYLMNRNEGTSHTLTVIRVCGLFNRL
ncbi:hypothetical protein [Herminiimonas sp. CN]|uniref:hypothetical protein n=1 Tax=Herminiimonas sp. CN TaxID=1349818 RepID=UPI0012DFCE6D|nr:hypothetical protein [Herminiimonas sp. CN]